MQFRQSYNTKPWTENFVQILKSNETKGGTFAAEDNTIII